MTPTGSQIDLGDGRLFDPLDPFDFTFRVEDIAGPLSRICRWGGRCSRFYSVAQHSLHVCALVEASLPDLAMHALLHDAAEAFLGDLVKPIKDRMHVKVGGYSVSIGYAEHLLLRSIRAAFGVREPGPADELAIKDADEIALRTEARDLMGAPDWAHGVVDSKRIDPLAPEAAERAFLAAFERLRAMGVGR